MELGRGSWSSLNVLDKWLQGIGRILRKGDCKIESLKFRLEYGDKKEGILQGFLSD